MPHDLPMLSTGLIDGFGYDSEKFVTLRLSVDRVFCIYWNGIDIIEYLLYFTYLHARDSEHWITKFWCMTTMINIKKAEGCSWLFSWYPLSVLNLFWDYCKFSRQILYRQCERWRRHLTERIFTWSWKFHDAKNAVDFTSIRLQVISYCGSWDLKGNHPTNTSRKRIRGRRRVAINTVSTR